MLDSLAVSYICGKRLHLWQADTSVASGYICGNRWAFVTEGALRDKCDKLLRNQDHKLLDQCDKLVTEVALRDNCSVR